MKKQMITSQIAQLRDPFILHENGTYFAYGTGWVCFEKDDGDLDGAWISHGEVVQVPADSVGDHWAPEVHKFGEKYYMFTTYRSRKNNHRGCAIFVADTPLGPFTLNSDGHVTPDDWDAIDGTLYIDKNGAPWMVFVHEWTSTEDGIGRMAAAMLSDDLSHFITRPVELFRADAPQWAKGAITDGCFLYRSRDGKLLMLWSNFDRDGYAIGIAESNNGEIDGNWTQQEQLLYSKSIGGVYDGGHGMLFHDNEGQLWLSMHSPNEATDKRRETPVFLPMREENGTLVWVK